MSVHRSLDPEEAMDAVGPDDRDPEPGAPHDCRFAWIDAFDLHPSNDGPLVRWHCTRPADHRGQHVAAAISSHVAAVHPGTDPESGPEN